jgi:hypothetical protein
MRKQDLTGKVFTRLTVVKETNERFNGSLLWVCICECGNTKKVNTKQLNAKLIQSCGCLQKDNGTKQCL